MKIKTNIKAGRYEEAGGGGTGGNSTNHNQTVGTTRKLMIKTHVKAGVACVARPSFAPDFQTVPTDESSPFNRNQTTECGLKVKTSVKAGGFIEK